MKSWLGVLENLLDALQVLSQLTSDLSPTEVSIKEFNIHLFTMAISDCHDDYVEDLPIFSDVCILEFVVFQIDILYLLFYVLNQVGDVLEVVYTRPRRVIYVRLVE